MISPEKHQALGAERKLFLQSFRSDMKIGCPPDCNNCESRFKSVFKNLAPSKLATMNHKKHFFRYKKGEVIFEQGASPKGVHCIYSGKVKICRLNVEGKHQIIHIAGTGDIMGYRALISTDKYSCTAIATEETSICILPQSLFMSMLEGDSKLSVEVLHLVCNEMGKLEKSITVATQRSAKERLSQCLLFMIDNYGFIDDSKIINTNSTREEIANIIGTSRETATRLLYSLSDDNIIRIKGKKIEIIDLTALEKTANSSD